MATTYEPGYPVNFYSGENIKFTGRSTHRFEIWRNNPARPS